MFAGHHGAECVPGVRGAEEPPPPHSMSPLLASDLLDAKGKCFTLMGIDIW